MKFIVTILIVVIAISTYTLYENALIYFDEEIYYFSAKGVNFAGIPALVMNITTFAIDMVCIVMVVKIITGARRN